MSEQRIPVEQRTHPLHVFTGRVLARLDQLGAPSPVSLSAREFAEVIEETALIVSRVSGQHLGLVASADATDLASEVGEVNAAGLVRTLTKQAGPEARRTVKLARDLEAHPVIRGALLSGVATVDQVQEIVTAVEALPISTGAGARVEAELHLVDAAGKHDPRELRALGKHLVEVVDPDHADELLNQRLEAEERKASRKSFLEFFDCRDGSSDFRGNMTNLHRAMLERFLGALMNPNRPDPIDLQGQSRAEARGVAFGQLLERIPANRISRSGGVNATVIVTMTLDTLLGGLQAASLDTGQRISAREARRLACAAGIIPAVLDGDGAVLDLGPHVRFHTPKQRLAMNLQQHGLCAVEGCDRPAWLCDGAHLVAWQDGGTTSVANGALLCPRHHTLADNGRYQIVRIGPGRIRLTRRQ